MCAKEKGVHGGHSHSADRKPLDGGNISIEVLRAISHGVHA